MSAERARGKTTILERRARLPMGFVGSASLSCTLLPEERRSPCLSFEPCPDTRFDRVCPSPVDASGGAGGMGGLGGVGGVGDAEEIEE